MSSEPTDERDWTPSSLSASDSALSGSALDGYALGSTLGASSWSAADEGGSFSGTATSNPGGGATTSSTARAEVDAATALRLDSVSMSSAHGPVSARLAQEFGGQHEFGGAQEFGGPQEFGGAQEFGGPQEFGEPQEFGGQQEFREPQEFGGQQEFQKPQEFGGAQEFTEPNEFGDDRVPDATPDNGVSEYAPPQYAPPQYAPPQYAPSVQEQGSRPAQPPAGRAPQPYAPQHTAIAQKSSKGSSGVPAIVTGLISAGVGVANVATGGDLPSFFGIVIIMSVITGFSAAAKPKADAEGLHRALGIIGLVLGVVGAGIGIYGWF